MKTSLYRPFTVKHMPVHLLLENKTEIEFDSSICFWLIACHADRAVEHVEWARC